MAELTWADRERLLAEVVMGVPASESEVAPSQEATKYRERLARDVQKLLDADIAPDPPKD